MPQSGQFGPLPQQARAPVRSSPGGVGRIREASSGRYGRLALSRRFRWGLVLLAVIVGAVSALGGNWALVVGMFFLTVSHAGALRSHPPYT